ncbi:hypothetical protein [Altererythrobacter sp. MF3-039]|uniref:hypothetical protein n=1 Tax=Altererythrobacter sp. MF3-039 TaxID=3252901 RepID=UPI00390CA4E4
MSRFSENIEANEDWTDYGSAGDIPVGPRLSSYHLHTAEWREAFLERLVAVGEPALLEATSRVYELLAEPKDYRSALIAKAAGVTGIGKIAILYTLQAFLDEWLQPTQPLPPPSSFEDVQSWHKAATRVWNSDSEREQWVVKKFAAVLDGKAISEFAHS